jgi:hypothetical protein
MARPLFIQICRQMEQRIFNIFVNSTEPDVRFQPSSMIVTKRRKEGAPITIKRGDVKGPIRLFCTNFALYTFRRTATASTLLPVSSRAIRSRSWSFWRSRSVFVRQCRRV